MLKRLYGAGCIPYSLDDDGSLVFLFHSMIYNPEKKSKKLGYYVDCGGGRIGEESLKVTAVREFNEETMWVFADHLGYGSHEEAINNMLPLLENKEAIIFSAICWEYHSYLINLPFINSNILNKIFEEKRLKVNEKARMFHWLTLENLENCCTLNQSSNQKVKPIYPRLDKNVLLEQARHLEL